MRCTWLATVDVTCLLAEVSCLLLVPAWCCCCLLAAAVTCMLLLLLACCCCFLVAVLNWLCIQLTLPPAILMTHLSYMTLLEIYQTDCTRMTSRLSRKESTVTPLYNGYYIIVELQQKHHDNSYVIGWLLVHATTRSKQQRHWYNEKGLGSVGGQQQWWSVVVVFLMAEFWWRKQFWLTLLSLW